MGGINGLFLRRCPARYDGMNVKNMEGDARGLYSAYIWRQRKPWDDLVRILSLHATIRSGYIMNSNIKCCYTETFSVDTGEPVENTERR
jgi:hypothetical protein